MLHQPVRIESALKSELTLQLTTCYPWSKQAPLLLRSTSHFVGNLVVYSLISPRSRTSINFISMSKFLWASPASDLIQNAPKRLCTTRHQQPWALDRYPVNRGMPLNCTQLLLSRIRQRPPWSHVFLPYSRRLLRATTRHTVSTRQFNSLTAKSSAAMARRQHDSPTERNQEAHLGHQSAGSATQQASTFESKPPNRFSKRHFPHSWEVSHTCSLTSAAILSTKVFPVLQNNNLVS